MRPGEEHRPRVECDSEERGLWSACLWPPRRVTINEGEGEDEDGDA
jgi:hypothetical protein